MKKINTLLNLDEKELRELEERIVDITDKSNRGLGYMVTSDRVAEELYQIMSTTNDIELSLRMLEVSLKIFNDGRSLQRSIDLVIDYYCINKLGFFKDELEEMIK